MSVYRRDWCDSPPSGRVNQSNPTHGRCLPTHQLTVLCHSIFYDSAPPNVLPHAPFSSRRHAGALSGRYNFGISGDILVYTD